MKKLDGSYKAQIQDYLDYIADVKDKTSRTIMFELFIRGELADVPTHITQPMKQFLNDNGIVLMFIEGTF